MSTSIPFGFLFLLFIAKVVESYPTLSSSKVESILKGLGQFLQIFLEAGQNLVAMSSQVVDVAWHKFILSTRRTLTWNLV